MVWPQYCSGSFFVGIFWGFVTTLLCSASVIYFHVNFDFTKADLKLPSYWDPELWGVNLLTDQIGSMFLMYIVTTAFVLTKKRAQDELSDSQEKMFHNSRMAELGEVAGGIAHEINNPLTVIQANARKIIKLLEEKNHQDIKERSQKIIDTTSRISKIIKGLKNYSRDGQLDPFQPVNLDQIIDEVQEIYLDKLKYYQISFEYKPEAKSIQVFARYAQLYQIIVNLINNSIDAIEELEEKKIVVKVSRVGSKVKISIQDSGPGIPKEIEEKVFTPFFTTKTIGKGTGLGLPIVDSLVKEHKGEIKIDRSGKLSSIDVLLNVA